MKFGVVGVIAFVIDYGLLALLTEAFGVNYLVSATISFTVSVIFNYLASMRYVFTHKEGMSRRRAFVAGSLSGIVEPIFGVAVVLAAGWISPYMPWLLSFAAGAMIYVVVEELVPEAHLGEHSNVGTLGFIAGFVVMMVLDVALG